MDAPREVVRVELEAPDTADARRCLAAYFKELDKRFERGFNPDVSISASAEELNPPAGVFLIARLGTRPVGCGALKVGAKGIGEIKRMWVAPDLRGCGIGCLILDSLEAYAKDQKLKTLRLETNHTLKEARGLYRTAGFAEVKAFNEEPYAHHWFEKNLPYD